jgi:hypothetical protein
MVEDRVGGLLPTRRKPGTHEQEVHQQNPKVQQMREKIFLAERAFLETRPKNKDVLGPEALSRTDGFHGSGEC